MIRSRNTSYNTNVFIPYRVFLLATLSRNINVMPIFNFFYLYRVFLALSMDAKDRGTIVAQGGGKVSRRFGKQYTSKHSSKL